MMHPSLAGQGWDPGGHCRTQVAMADLYHPGQPLPELIHADLPPLQPHLGKDTKNNTKKGSALIYACNW